MCQEDAIRVAIQPDTTAPASFTPCFTSTDFALSNSGNCRASKTICWNSLYPTPSLASPFHQRHSHTISFIEIQTTIQRGIDLLETDEHENEQLKPRKLFAGERLQGVPSIRLRIVDTSRAEHPDFKSDLLNPFFRH